MELTQTPDAVQTAAEEVLFLTKYPGFRLVMEPGRHPYKMIDGSMVPGTNGRHIEFEGIEYRTSDPEEINFLRNCDDFVKNGNIWEFGRAPGEARPTVAEQMNAITSASVERDAVALQELIDSEQSTHNRALIIESATNALRSIAGVPEEV